MKASSGSGLWPTTIRCLLIRPHCWRTGARHSSFYQPHAPPSYNRPRPGGRGASDTGVGDGPALGLRGAVAAPTIINNHHQEWFAMPVQIDVAVEEKALREHGMLGRGST